MSAVRSKPKSRKLRALLQRHSLDRGALRQHCMSESGFSKTHSLNTQVNTKAVQRALVVG